MDDFTWQQPIDQLAPVVKEAQAKMRINCKPAMDRVSPVSKLLLVIDNILIDRLSINVLR